MDPPYFHTVGRYYGTSSINFEEFLDFQLKEFVGMSKERMEFLTRKHFDTIVKPRVRPKALDYVKSLLADGKRCAILTSTNEVIARPVGNYFGITEVYGAQLETVDNVYTGKLAGIYTAGQGKVEVVKKLSETSGIPLSDFAAFGDSINDLPMLKSVGHPYAVSPGKTLAEAAQELNFEVLDWKL